MLSVQDQIGILKQLQEVDTQIYRLRRERQAKPIAIEELQAALAVERQHLTQLEVQHKALQSQHKTQELELATREEQVKKLQGQLYQLKTNREYTAMQKEIEGAKADNSLLEETIIALLEQIDQTQTQAAAAKTAWQRREGEVRQQVQHLEQEMVALDQQIQAAEADRQRLVPSLEPTVLQQYERILRSRDGLALVPVVREACGGCYMVLPPQVINEAAQQQRLVACGSCARLLYADES